MTTLSDKVRRYQDVDCELMDLFALAALQLETPAGPQAALTSRMRRKQHHRQGAMDLLAEAATSIENS